jgi:hypothetical protein
MKRIFALVILAATLGTALSGCIVVPDGGYHNPYRYHDRYCSRRAPRPTHSIIRTREPTP